MLVSGSLTPDACGVGDYTHSLANALAQDAQDDVAVLTTRADRPGSGKPAERSYTLLPIMTSWRLRDALDLYRAIRRWRPDVVHVQYPTQGYGRGRLPPLIPLIATVAGAKVARTWHEGFGRRQLFGLLADYPVGGPSVVVRPDFDRHVAPLVRPLIAGRHREFIASASSIPPTRLSPAQLVAHRDRLLAGARRLIVYFGFLYRKKGVDRLFAAADPATDRIVIIGEDSVDPDYVAELRRLAAQPEWRDRVAFTGSLPAGEVADALAAADVVVLPFAEGGGIWNSSIHAAVQQGTPVITTVSGPAGLSDDELVRYVPVDDDAGIRHALASVPQWRTGRIPPGSEWARVAQQHRALYAAPGRK